MTVSPGRRWFAAEPPAPHLRLTFAGADPARLAEGVRRLGAAAPELAASALSAAAPKSACTAATAVGDGSLNAEKPLLAQLRARATTTSA